MQTWDKSNCRRVELQSDRKVDHPGMMQEFDQPLIEKFELFLKGDQKCNFLSGITNIDMNIAMIDTQNDWIQFNIRFNIGFPKFNSNNYSIQK